MAALGRALAAAYVDSARYLADAVAYGVGRCDPTGPQAAAPREQAGRAAAAARRLDDTFRGYLSERGAKPAPLAEVTGLVTGVVGVRLAADAVLDLWDRDGAAQGYCSAARQQLMVAAANLTGWYNHFAAGLTGNEEIPEPLAPDQVTDGQLVTAVGHDLQDSDGQATLTGVRVIWTGDHLDAARRLQAALVEPARTAVSEPGADCATSSCPGIGSSPPATEQSVRPRVSLRRATACRCLSGHSGRQGGIRPSIDR